MTWARRSDAAWGHLRDEIQRSRGSPTEGQLSLRPRTTRYSCVVAEGASLVTAVQLSYFIVIYFLTPPHSCHTLQVSIIIIASNHYSLNMVEIYITLAFMFLN